MTDATYAGGRKMYDADSHIMETLEWLSSYATPEQTGLVAPLATEKGGQFIEKAIARAEQRFADPAATAELIKEPIISGPKGWGAYGAFDALERSAALDLLGFQKQLVFPTFSMGQFAFSPDLDVVYGGTDMLNRRMADFCGADDRLLAVGFVSLQDPLLALRAVEAGLQAGIAAFWVSSDPVSDARKNRSPSHVDHDPIWAAIEAANVPMVLHIGGGRGLDESYHNAGHAKTSDWLGGGENLRGKDFHAISHSPQNFLTAMIYDQVFQRFPGLMCGVIEIGATWVPGFLRTLDQGHMAFRKSEPLLNSLEMKPSEIFQKHVRVSLFPYEDAGWLIEQAGSDVFMFASDYPHPEGGRDPVGRFDSTLDALEVSRVDRDSFYHGNFAALMGIT